MDTSWKWRKKRGVPKHEPLKKVTNTIRVSVTTSGFICSSTEYSIIRLDNSYNLIYGFHPGSNYSKHAYLKTYALLWNNGVINKLWHEYSKEEYNEIESIFNDEISKIDDVWLKDEYIEPKKSSCFELEFSGTRIVNIRESN